MYYPDICNVIRESEEKTFVCEIINGNTTELELDVQEDAFYPTPVYYGTHNVLPWFIARDIISITPRSKYGA